MPLYADPSSSPPHVVVVEDDKAMREMVVNYLKGQGLAVTGLASAEEMLLRLPLLQPDLAVLDVGLPGMSGLQACQRMRKAGESIPIILLTAHSDEIDRVLGLELGADDFLGKPFSARELLARIRAVLRRVTAVPCDPQGTAGQVRIGDFIFSVSTRSLHRGAQIKLLTTVEYALLAELTARPGAVVSRERLLSVSQTRKEQVLLRAVDAAIMRLRKIVEPDPAFPRHILTVRGQGYVFVAIAGEPE